MFLVNIWDKINLETSEDAFLGKTDFSDTVEIRWWGVYIDVSQTKHGKMQEKISDYMPRVNSKLVNCSLSFVSAPIYHQKNTYTSWKPLFRRIPNFDVRI